MQKPTSPTEPMSALTAGEVPELDILERLDKVLQAREDVIYAATKLMTDKVRWKGKPTPAKGSFQFPRTWTKAERRLWLAINELNGL